MTDNPDHEVQVNKGRRVGMTVSLRLRPEDAEVLASLSRRYDTTLSETVRLALNALAHSADYTKLTVQSSGLSGFTRAESRGPLDEHSALTA